MFCPNCGQKFEDTIDFCPNCGARVSRQNIQQPVPGPALQSGGQQIYKQPGQQFKRTKTKKRSGCLVSLIVFICIIGLGVLAVYFFVPGLLKPFDLGIKTSNQAYESTMQKLGFEKDRAPASGTAEDYIYTYGDPREVDVSLDSEEITSFLNTNRPPYYALKNVQIKINSDNKVEAAATLDVSYVFDNMLAGKYTREDAQKAIPMIGLLPDEINIYCKISGGLKDNRADNINLSDVKVLGIPLPESLTGSSDARAFINETIGDYVEKTSGKSNTRFDLLKVEDGELVFKGQIPSSISRSAR